MIVLALCMHQGEIPQTQELKAKPPVVSHSKKSDNKVKLITKQSPRDIRMNQKPLMSRHGNRELPWHRAKATCYTLSENGKTTANGERCFSNGPEYLCAMPSNLNPNRLYCKHESGQCHPIYVSTVVGTIITVHCVDHCPKSGVIDFNPAAANMIFLGKKSSKQDWWSKDSIIFSREK